MRQLNQPAQHIFLFIELVLVATCLGIFVHGHSTGLRTALWSVGGEHGWNSNPRLRIYFYANYQKPPEIPFLWTEKCSESLLAVALVNVTIWMAKVALFCCGFNIPLLSAFYHLLMSGLWMFCVHVQSSSDLTDLEHISIRPWYLKRTCAALAQKDGDVCKHGKIAFATAVICMAFYLCGSVMSILRLAYWCGQYRVLDRCASSGGEHWLELQRGHQDSNVRDVHLLGWEPVYRYSSIAEVWDGEPTQEMMDSIEAASVSADYIH